MPDGRMAITYDAVWGLAMAIHMTVITLKDSINSSIPNKLFIDEMKWIEFHGASGFISFDNVTMNPDALIITLWISSTSTAQWMIIWLDSSIGKGF